jgi:hypothetical protein
VGGRVVYGLQAKSKLKPLMKWMQRRYMHVSGITDIIFRGEYFEKEKELQKRNTEVRVVARSAEMRTSEADTDHRRSDQRRQQVEARAALQREVQHISQVRQTLEDEEE